jgi:hypothetical protein
MNVKLEVDRHRLPCGPMTVSIEGVCRRRIRDHFDSLLDRLTLEIHPEGHDHDQAQMVQEGKKKADAKMEIDKYKEKLLMGNSKLLQDPSGKLPKK